MKILKQIIISLLIAISIFPFLAFFKIIIALGITLLIFVALLLKELIEKYVIKKVKVFLLVWGQQAFLPWLYSIVFSGLIIYIIYFYWGFLPSPSNYSFAILPYQELWFTITSLTLSVPITIVYFSIKKDLNRESLLNSRP